MCYNKNQIWRKYWNVIIKIKTNFNITDNHDSFSARPTELLSLYDENILDEELLAIVNRTQSFSQNIKIIKTSKNESITENENIYYLEYQSHYSKTLANYFLDIKV